MAYPKRLIEIDLPIKRISAHARREKSIRHGHISTLHIWWARRPLAACRAVLCAALWPAPADSLCPPSFREVARAEMRKWTANQRLKLLGAESQARFQHLANEPALLDDDSHLQQALFDFIADFANWDNSTNPAYLETARTLTQAAHEALGGLPGTRPLVVDPFAGGGSIPLEALRIGADAFASDLNPVAVLLNKVVLEYIPKYGRAELRMRNANGEEVTFQGLAEAVRYWGNWVKEQAQRELAPFYPKDPDGATPIAYLWARTIICEGPGCGAEVPLMRSKWLARTRTKSVGLRLMPNYAEKRVDFEIVQGATGREFNDGTVHRGAAVCPCCGYTTPVERVRAQLRTRRGGSADARLYGVVTTKDGRPGRVFRLPSCQDGNAAKDAEQRLIRLKKEDNYPFDPVPREQISFDEVRRISPLIYGMTTWGDYYTPRQCLTLTTLARLVDKSAQLLQDFEMPFGGITEAVQVCLSLAVDRVADRSSCLTRWDTGSDNIGSTFGRQALPMVWDFAEVGPLAQASGDWGGAVEWILRVLEQESIAITVSGAVEQISTTEYALPDHFAEALITDPPYYDAVPYSHLSDFFYIWLRRCLFRLFPQFLAKPEVPKDKEIVVVRSHRLSTSDHDMAFYERALTKALSEARRVTKPHGIGAIVFASKTTASWEAFLEAVVEAGWVITGSWPIDTELSNRVAAQGQARLGSSVHLVCRPRESTDGVLTTIVGDWRDVLQELPLRIHTWLPRLAAEGIVGADAIFACLGPALEIFSRYARVEKVSGEVVTLSEYLEHVWAAVSREALNMVFAGADTAGFEEDARLTAMWLWTLTGGGGANGSPTNGRPHESEDGEEGNGRNGKKSAAGFALEYDAARKIAQGLGAHLEQLRHLVEIKGGNARLLPVSERTRYLFGKEFARQTPARRPKTMQMELFEERVEYRGSQWVFDPEQQVHPGLTTLDRIHQAMLLFGAGRSDALKRFLTEDDTGADDRFWRLAQVLSALYPKQSEEKRWVDGVLGRKKALGF
ncbi:MAG: adenine-specific DNA methylase [Chloroflexi bacterium]|nr:MAG: adenine-specific DNA methylase [Chloroflexota bacterium]